MNLIYAQSESAMRPQEMEVGVTTVYLRRNIAETVRENPDGGTVTMYVYQEAQMPKDQALRYLAGELEVTKQKLEAAIRSNAMLEDCLVEMAETVYA